MFINTSLKILDRVLLALGVIVAISSVFVSLDSVNGADWWVLGILLSLFVQVVLLATNYTIARGEKGTIKSFLGFVALFPLFFVYTSYQSIKLGGGERMFIEGFIFPTIVELVLAIAVFLGLVILIITFMRDQSILPKKDGEITRKVKYLLYAEIGLSAFTLGGISVSNDGFFTQYLTTPLITMVLILHLISTYYLGKSTPQNTEV